MRYFAPKLILTFMAALTLGACGGGGGGSGGGGGGGGGTTNSPPTANAGANQTVSANSEVTLIGSASTDSDGTIANYAWTQTAGPAVALSGGGTAQQAFVAPDVNVQTTLTFSLVVTDNRFASSSADTVDVIVNPAPNNLPTANAGANLTTTSGFIVTLNGSASTDSDGSVANYAWTQTAGAAVTLSGGSTALPTFTAPTVSGAATTITFSLVVTDNRGGVSTADTVDVLVNPPLAGMTNINGTITFVRIPATDSNGLDYGSPQTQLARGVLVRARNISNSVIASATTGNNGDYVLNVPNSTQIRIEVVSQMTRSGTPSWDFRVQDGPNGNSPYVYSDNAVFDSSSVTSKDLLIPSGFNLAGAVTGVRASAPFAILDTVYRGVQTVLGPAPTTNFPTLVLDWAENNPAGDTYFTTSGSGVSLIQYIVLSADVTRDTDEFDQHVVAHEFGHYIEYNYSRADNIGGSHAIGDKLDIRTAFGEGFGYAFAAIVLNDPIAKDTAVQAGNKITSRFDIEDNPPAPGDPSGCWCSESSVWAILWDVYDFSADANDNVALGFAPMWSVLTTAQKNTPAFTSIFSFVTALKAANSGSAAAIDTLVASQNITTAGMDAFGATETHFPTTTPIFPTNAALPIYTNATLGAAVIVQTVNDAGRYNRVGNHRFVRFTVPASQVVTITLSTSNTNNPDPDFRLYKNGIDQIPFPGGQGTGSTETYSLTLQPATYVLDAYDCANGCDTEEGTPGDYALTVTIQ